MPIDPGPPAFVHALQAQPGAASLIGVSRETLNRAAGQERARGRIRQPPDSAAEEPRDAKAQPCERRRRVEPKSPRQQPCTFAMVTFISDTFGESEAAPGMGPPHHASRDRGLLVENNFDHQSPGMVHAPPVGRPAANSDPVSDQELGHDLDRIAPRELQLEKQVLGEKRAPAIEPLFIAADFERRRPRQQRPAAVADEVRVKVVDQHTAPARIGSNRPGEVGIGVDRPEEAIDEAGRLRRGQRGVDLPFQLGRMPQIVGIDRRDERSAPPRDAQVSRRRAATSPCKSASRAGRRLQSSGQRRRCRRSTRRRRRTPRWCGSLGQHRAERLSQRPLGIEGRDDDGDQRICRRHGAATAAAYLPRFLRWLSRSSTAFASPSGSRPSRRATS